MHLPLNKPVNILFLPSWYPTKVGDLNGIFNQEMAHELAAQYNIFVLHLAFDSDVNKIEISRNANKNNLWESIVRIPKRNFLWNQWQYFRIFFSELKRWESTHGKIQLVHVSVAWKMGLFALLLNKMRSLKCAVTEHFTGYLPSDDSLKGYKKSFSLRILKSASAVSVVGHGLKEALKDHHIDATVIPNFIHPEILAFSEPVSQTRHTSFVHVSGFQLRQKQTDKIVFAFNELKSKYPEITLTLVVPKPKWEAFLSKHTGMDVSGISILEPGLSRNEYCKLISEKHCAISYSLFETFSLTTAEALCLGVPVIYTNSGGPEHYVKAEHGICADKDNVDSLLQAMEQFVIHKRFDNHEIKQYYKDLFSSRATLLKYEKFYKEVLS